MNQPQSNPQKRLHSPLLDGTFQKNNKKHNSSLPTPLVKNNQVNDKYIDALETTFKISGTFILALGGILTVLQLIYIVNNYMATSKLDSGGLLIFGVLAIGTLLSNLICLGFLHLVKTIKTIHNNIEDHNTKLNDILKYYDRVNYKGV